MLKLSRFQLIFSAQEKIIFTQFPGSALRGVFGNALKAISCTTQRTHCQGCLQKTQCAFPQVFKTTRLEKQRLNKVSQPLVLDTSEVPNKMNAGDTFAIYINLVGESTRFIDNIIQAWEFAGQLGLDSQGKKVTFQLQSAYTVDVAMPKAIRKNKSVSIDLITPHRAFRREGHKRIRQLITPKTFIGNTYIANIVRRYKNLQRLYGETLSQENSYQLMNASYALDVVNQSLISSKHYRISKNQNKKLDLSGLVGQISIQGDALPSLLPVLWLGQWLHVGNNPMYGLGRYRITGESHV